MTARARNLFIAAALLLAVVGVIVAGSAGRTSRSESVAPPLAAASSPAPSATASIPSSVTSSPSPSPSASPQQSASPSATAAATRYGFVRWGPGGLDLVSEGGTVVQRYGCGAAPCRVAVSPDGRRVAYWRTGQTPDWDLRVFETASPTSVRTVLTVPEPQRGTEMVWSTDSQGILYSTVIERTSGPVSGPQRATINAVEVASTQPHLDVMPARVDGTFYLPIAWDRSASRFAAVRSGEGGFIVDYAFADPSGYRATQPPQGFMIAGGVEASFDMTRVLVIDQRANVVRIWSIADATKAFDVGPGANRTITEAHWLPSGGVLWSVENTLGVFYPQTDGIPPIYTATSVLTLLAVRADGTAALVAQRDGPPLFVDFATRAATRAPLSEDFLPRGVFLP